MAPKKTLGRNNKRKRSLDAGGGGDDELTPDGYVLLKRFKETNEVGVDDKDNNITKWKFNKNATMMDTMLNESYYPLLHILAQSAPFLFDTPINGKSEERGGKALDRVLAFILLSMREGETNSINSSEDALKKKEQVLQYIEKLKERVEKLFT